MTIPWAERIANLTQALGRKPTLEELLEASHAHQMTPAAIEEKLARFFELADELGIVVACEVPNFDPPKWWGLLIDEERIPYRAPWRT